MCHKNGSNIDTLKTRRRIADALPKTATPEQLIEIAGILGVEVEYLPLRPNFGPDQVRSICQLRAGLTYKYVYGDSVVGAPPWTFTVLDEPFPLTDAVWGGWRVKIKDEGGGHVHAISP